MINIDCTSEAYDRLIKSGIYDKIIENKSEISDLITGQVIYEDTIGNNILKKSKEIYYDSERRISERSEAAKDIIDLDYKLMESKFSWGNEELFIRHPALISQIVMGDDMGYKSRGFPSLGSMYKSIASFCLGNRSELRLTKDYYKWRNDKVSNEIDLNVHGDFFVRQNDVSSKLERTLFGEEFETTKFEPESGGMSSYQSTSGFLISVLRYAEHMGLKNIPEIQNWEKTLEETGSYGAAVAEAFGGGSLSIGFFSKQLPFEGKKVPSMAIEIHSGGDMFVEPIVGKDNNLYFRPLSNTMSLIIGDDYKVKFSKEDIPHLLKASYKLFTRDKSLLPKIMNGFLNS